VEVRVAEAEMAVNRLVYKQNVILWKPTLNIDVVSII
jgi:hypothetical protein